MLNNPFWLSGSAAFRAFEKFSKKFVIRKFEIEYVQLGTFSVSKLLSVILGNQSRVLVFHGASWIYSMNYNKFSNHEIDLYINTKSTTCLSNIGGSCSQGNGIHLETSNYIMNRIDTFTE